MKRSPDTENDLTVTLTPEDLRSIAKLTRGAPFLALSYGIEWAVMEFLVGKNLWPQDRHFKSQILTIEDGNFVLKFVADEVKNGGNERTVGSNPG